MMGPKQMIKKNKVYTGILVISLLLICFQNCGQQRPQESAASPGDDHVIKLCPPGSEGLEGCASTTSTDLQDESLLTEAIGSENTPLPPQKRDDLNLNVKKCEKLLGSQRSDCLDEAIKAYYEALSKVGYVVSSGLDCFLAYKPGLNGAIHYVSTCKTVARLDERRGLHLDACLKFPGVRKSLDKISAFAFFRRAKVFEHLDSVVRYPQASPKHVEIYDFNRNSPVFKDACDIEQHAEASGTFIEF
jgi:hypothetical protein